MRYSKLFDTLRLLPYAPTFLESIRGQPYCLDNRWYIL